VPESAPVGTVRQAQWRQPYSVSLAQGTSSR
jgi:hypothetical protein